MNALIFAVLLTAAPAGDALDEMRLILQCGTGDIPRAICCRIALERVRDAHLEGDLETERILGNYLKKNCPKPMITPR